MITKEKFDALNEKLDAMREGLEEMQGGTQRTLVLLLHDYTKIGKREIVAILDALESHDFAQTYFGEGSGE